MRRWVDVALEEGVRFFVTALGNPRWVVERVHAAGGVVYHDVTERRWAEKALDQEVDGLDLRQRACRWPCRRAQPGAALRRARRPRRAAGLRRRRRRRRGVRGRSPPRLCRGADGHALHRHHGMHAPTTTTSGRSCAADEPRTWCSPTSSRESPAPCCGRRSSSARGCSAGPLARRLLRGRRTKHWMRSWYALRSLWTLKRASLRGLSYREVFQAGKSVAGDRRGRAGRGRSSERSPRPVRRRSPAPAAPR